ncbi:MAG: hypothetical protein EP330_12930 [Deltaproteobacteria bacterium]|nr:MAG: hypothetical protein EP330_12930 [Deltaproteobacteria bacterium]
MLPDVAVITAPTHEAKVPHPVASTPELAAARERLDAVVRAEAVVGDHPWALGHALLAFGPDLALPDGRSAVDATFADYGEEVDVAGKTLVRFPTSRGAVRIQPHAELLLKAFTEIGVPANREVQVAGTTHPVSDLYLHALSRSWTHGDRTGFDSYNDAPWALQAIATWAPGELAWTADGHEMTLDKYTSDVVAKLAADTKFMHDAFAAGAPLQKRKQGIFGYTCGGAHMLQGAMFAVGKGYGSDADKDKISAELAVLFPRLPFEVELVDGLLKQHPEYQVVLIEQRLKFLGHWVETLYKAEAMGLIEPSEAQRAQMELAVDQLVKTVIAIDKLGIYGKLDTVKASNEQTYLDYVGDSAHALRALDLATGQGVVRY